jgi:hypothetical protein
MVGGGEPGEPDKYSLDTPKSMALEDPGARAASPGATLPRTLAPTSRITKSCGKLPASLPSYGPTPTTSTPAPPYEAPPALVSYSNSINQNRSNYMLAQDLVFTHTGQ